LGVKVKGHLSRTTWIVLLVVWVLALGALAVLAEGFVPKTMSQVLLAVLLVGPILVLGEVLLQVVCYGVSRALLYP
jgi:hypothetical protein